jgi:hypothetical protein
VKRFEPTPPWVSLEVLRRDDDGQLSAETGARPFSDDLLSGGDRVVQAVGLMWLVQYHGWPEARRQLRDSDGRNRIVLAGDRSGARIWLLKAKPSCWRLYFYVYEQTKQILYLHATCKKQDAQDDAAEARARRILTGVGGSGSRYGAVEFDFPDPQGV